MTRRHRQATRWKFDCRGAHGQDRCRYDKAFVTSGDPLWLPASDRRRLAAARAEIEAVYA